MGASITKEVITPQKLHIRTDHLQTLNDFQKLLGDINWIRPYLKLPTADLKPLFNILEGDPHITSPRSLTPAARLALAKVEKALETTQLKRVVPGQRFCYAFFQHSTCQHVYCGSKDLCSGFIYIHLPRE